MKKILPFLLLAGLTVSCKREAKTPQTGTSGSPAIQAPVFQADSAYAFVQSQMAFGPRVPGTPSHQRCKDWMVKTFGRMQIPVMEQSFQAAFPGGGKKYTATNVIARYKPDLAQRVILAAHWDSRQMADYDPVAENKKKPVPGADDGASGVGVLLEVARILSSQDLPLGVDFVLFDAEDQGESQGNENTWCLGSQHWAANPHVQGYSPRFGILLDMVGARNATFFKEEISISYAPQIVERVWQAAKDIGYGQYFQDRVVSGVIDDHYFVNKIAGYRMIDIIHKTPATQTGFGAHWHTLGDDLQVIDKQTLKAVGQTVLQVLYQDAALVNS